MPAAPLGKPENVVGFKVTHSGTVRWAARSRRARPPLFHIGQGLEDRANP